MEEEVLKAPYDGAMNCDNGHHMAYQGVTSHDSLPGVAVQTWYCPQCDVHKTLNYRHR